VEGSLEVKIVDLVILGKLAIWDSSAVEIS
jgi:hypothetical protein